MTATIQAPTNPVLPTTEVERWRAECRHCAWVSDHDERESAHLAVVEHIAETGHTGETQVSGHFEIWQSESDGRHSVRAHQITISIGIRADGTYAGSA